MQLKMLTVSLLLLPMFAQAFWGLDFLTDKEHVEIDKKIKSIKTLTLEQLNRQHVQKCLDLNLNLESDFYNTGLELSCLDLLRKAKREGKTAFEIYEEELNPTPYPYTSEHVLQDEICKDIDRVAVIRKVRAVKLKFAESGRKAPNFLSAREMYCANLDGDNQNGLLNKSKIDSDEVLEKKIKEYLDRQTLNENVLKRKWNQFTGHKLVERTAYMNFAAVAMMGLLYSLPEETTNWNKNESMGDKSLVEHFGGKWIDNVKEGPVVDKDDPFINYIGHPVSGAWYYVMARKCGLSPMKSFYYSIFMSSLWWEYGFEATFEVPSIQDLIATPVLGAVLGEAFYQVNLKLIENNGELLGSKAFGKIVKIMMDPMTPMTEFLSSKLGRHIIGEVQYTLRPHETPVGVANRPDGSYEEKIYWRDLGFQVPIV